MFTLLHRFRFLLITVSLLLLPAALGDASVAAQDIPPQLTTWSVEVWPEHDQPSVLVIENGSFAPATIFPQRVRVTIPSSAKVYAVAYPDATGNLLTLPWTSEPGDQGQTVVFDLDQPSFRIEYYDDILTPPPNRSFDLASVVPYAAQQATLSLRQPSRSSDLQTTPVLDEAGVDALGNPSYTLSLGALAAGQSIPLQVNYTKPDADPSVSPTTAIAPVAMDEDGGQDWLLWGVALLAVLLLGAVAVYMVLRQRSGAISRQARRRESRKKGVQPERQPTAAQPLANYENKFCAQCGQRFDSSDKFCRSCGAARR